MFGGRSQLYSRLAALAEAGIPIGDAFSRIAQTSSGKTRHALNLASDSIQKGASLREAIEFQKFFDPFEVELITAGEQAGRLPDTFRALASVFEKKKKNLIAFLFAIAYPTFLMHAAILLPNVGTIISKGLGAYLLECGSQLSLIYFFCLSPFFIYFCGRFSPMAPTLDRVILSVPFLGSLLKKTEFARCATTLAYLYESGIPIIAAVEQTARICRNQAIKEVWSRAAERMSKTGTLNEALLSETLMPTVLSDFIATGENTGNLDETLLQAATILEDEAKNARRILMALVTGIAFCLAAGLAAYKIISFYANLYGKIGQIK